MIIYLIAFHRQLFLFPNIIISKPYKGMGYRIALVWIDVGIEIIFNR